MASIKKCCARSHFTGRAKCCDNCNCDEQRAAQALYMRNYRKLQKEKKAQMGNLRAVPDIPEPPPAPKPTTVKTQYPVGIIGQNAIKEIAAIPGADERNPLLVALIMRLASEIDRGEVAQLSSAANTIKRMMDELRAQSRPAEAPAADRPETPQDRFLADWRAAGQ